MHTQSWAVTLDRLNENDVVMRWAPQDGVRGGMEVAVHMDRATWDRLDPPKIVWMTLSDEAPRA